MDIFIIKPTSLFSVTLSLLARPFILQQQVEPAKQKSNPLMSSTYNCVYVFTCYKKIVTYDFITKKYSIFSSLLKKLFFIYLLLTIEINTVNCSLSCILSNLYLHKFLSHFLNNFFFIPQFTLLHYDKLCFCVIHKKEIPNGSGVSAVLRLSDSDFVRMRQK